MYVSRLRPVVFAAVASLLLLAAPASQAATMRYADISALTQHSDVVVRGRIVDADVYLDESNGHITTRWTLAVEESLKGGVTGTVSFTQWGGQLDGVIERIPGDAAFTMNEHAVVFLRVGEEGGLFLTALAQSKFAIIDQDSEGIVGVPASSLRLHPLTMWPGESLLVRDMRGVEIYDDSIEGSPEVTEMTLEFQSLEMLETEVRAAAEESR